MKERKQNRRKRTKWGSHKRQLNLDPETEKNLEKRKLKPRWVNDVKNGMRIQDLLARGYDFVCASGKELVGDRKEAQASGTMMSKRVGENRDGTAQMSYLMAIPEEYYKEDKELKEQENYKVDEAIKGGQPKGIKDHGVQSEQGGTYVKNVKYTP